MPDSIYDALRESHEIQRSLLRRLLRTKPGTQERISQFKQVRIELQAHEAAEERFLYAPMLMDDTGLSATGALFGCSDARGRSGREGRRRRRRDPR